MCLKVFLRKESSINCRHRRIQLSRQQVDAARTDQPAQSLKCFRELLDIFINFSEGSKVNVINVNRRYLRMKLKCYGKYENKKY